MTFFRAEDQSVLPGDLHQSMEIQIVLLGVFAVDDDVIHNADGARALAGGITHGSLEGVLGHAEAKRESEDSRPSNWALESCLFQQFLISLTASTRSTEGLCGNGGSCCPAINDDVESGTDMRFIVNVLCDRISNLERTMEEQPALIGDLTRRGLRVDAVVQVDIESLDHSLAKYAEAVNSTTAARDVSKLGPKTIGRYSQYFS